MPGTPRFRIHLDNTDMSNELPPSEPITSAEMWNAANTAAVATLGYSAHITRTAYMCAEPFRRSREREWVPDELIEPAKSTTGRHPINWDT
jgi:hypothetical protein